jgi:ABC-type glycerol-3-phosphate transport system substrate-binding protein
MKKKLNSLLILLLAVVLSTAMLLDTVLINATEDLTVTSSESDGGQEEPLAENEETQPEEIIPERRRDDVYVTIEIADPYTDYLKKYPGALSPVTEIVVEAADYTDCPYEPEILTDYEGNAGDSVLTTEEDYIEWEVDIPQAGLYSIELNYYPIKGKSSSMTRSIQINGELPFAEARSLTFFRVWTDIRDENGVAIQQDKRGNDIRPSQTESPIWMTKQVRDTPGYINEPLKFYLNEGSNTIRLISIREPMLIRSMTIYNRDPLPTYAQIKADYNTMGYKTPEADLIKIQAENAKYKADPVIVPVFDRSSPLTEPNHPALLRMNSIGGYNWRDNGQFITWEFEVKKAGLYKIGIKERQNTINGSFSTRRVYIDGKIPFRELEDVVYMYRTDWQTSVLGGDEEPYEFYFDEGMHEITMEVALGKMAEILREVSDITTRLNSIYRSILVVTGPVPDVERDYEFDSIMPDVIADLKLQSERLLTQFNAIIEGTQMSGENAQILNKIHMQTAEMAAKTHTIASRFTAFEVNISSLGTWVMSTRSQPLSLDYLVIAPTDTKMPRANANFLENASFALQSFFASFFMDYSSISDYESEDAVTVWVGQGLTGGRDQAQILKGMAENTFTYQKGIPVNIQLIAMGALLPATLAGIGPDVALTVNQGDPVNYAARNAVVNLKDFPDFDEIGARFSQSALYPLQFEGGIYALPEVQTYPMLFYRKDILQELNIPIPQTWDDVIRILPILHKKQLNFGLPPAAGPTGVSMALYAILLYQNGGRFYSEDYRSSELDSRVAVDAFTFMTSLYNDYKVPVVMDFVNRFRTGSAPLGIADYSLFNQLSVFAPELDGIWDFTLIPGIRKEDGTIDRSSGGGVAACIVLENTDNKDNAWEFVKWWTSAEVQVQFGRELESLLGTAARYPTANLEALYQIPWSKSNFDNLMLQRQWVIGIPEVPGGYYTPRYLDFAFRDVINNAYDPGESLAKAAKAIDSEIYSKRKEFGLED